ncbi:MAG TPA: hypothetical protein VHB20_12935 [Verrucomicrobiae bacterium]|jgi:hypothetical protein|nr:hypothetical protein [Verrucomicrobiae bacterium]
MHTQVIHRTWRQTLAALGAMALSLAAHADNVAARYHFAGGADLSRQSNFVAATKLVELAPTVDFKNLVLQRFSTFLADGLPSPSASSAAAVRPLLDDWLRAESVAAVGGAAGGPVSFVVALRLEPKGSSVWEAALAKAWGSAGQSLSMGGAHGRSWGQGGTGLWLLAAGEWTILGRGSDLSAVRDDYLAQIQKQGRPEAALQQSCFEADVDWARLEAELPISLGALKPARTKIKLMAGPDYIFHMTAQVIYPEPIAWTSAPWTVPDDIIYDPVVSFTAAQNIAPFLKTDVFAGLPGDPFQQQFYCWAMGEMPFQSYMAWPVPDATNTMRQLSTQLPEAVGAKLKALDKSTLDWNAKHAQFVWISPSVRLVGPTLSPAKSRGRPFLFAEMFPNSPRKTNAPSQLFDQFKNRNDIVYYDWEMTGPRLEQWRLLSELLPVVQKITPAEVQQERKAFAATTNAPAGQKHIPSFALADNFMGGIAAPMNAITITEVAKTGANELTVKRRSPFLFTGLEWELLTHWMSHAPSVGHIDPHLLPPPAKMTGPGLPR